MAAIGAEVAADLLMYGKVEKLSQNAQTIYKVSIKLLHVSRKQLACSTVETLPLVESSGVRALTHGKNWYAKLVAMATGGTLVVKANIDRGAVVIDDEVKGNLASGMLTLSGIPEGRNTLRIEAKGYQSYETSITVHSGETLPHLATLVGAPKVPTPPRRKGCVPVCARARSCDSVREIAWPACGRRAAHDLRDQAGSADSDAQLTGRLSAAHSPDACTDAPVSDFHILLRRVPYCRHRAIASVRARPTSHRGRHPPAVASSVAIRLSRHGKPALAIDGFT